MKNKIIKKIFNIFMKKQNMEERVNVTEALQRSVNSLRSGRLINEAQVKQFIILPILRSLGWDDNSIDEIVPEYEVELPDGKRGLVDYALFLGGNPIVFIEAKRQSNVTVQGLEQVFTYAYNQSVPFLILTDGNIWKFYLNQAAGPPEERIFHSFEITNDEKITEYSNFFERFLSKAFIGKRETIDYVYEMKELDNKKKLTKGNIKEVWEDILENPDEYLQKTIIDCIVTYISTAVEVKCNMKPERREYIRSFK